MCETQHCSRVMRTEAVPQTFYKLNCECQDNDALFVSYTQEYLNTRSVFLTPITHSSVTTDCLPGLYISEQTTAAPHVRYRPH